MVFPLVGGFKINGIKLATVTHEVGGFASSEFVSVIYLNAPMGEAVALRCVNTGGFFKVVKLAFFLIGEVVEVAICNISGKLSAEGVADNFGFHGFSFGGG
jgi:hypothetical protein